MCLQWLRAYFSIIGLFLFSFPIIPSFYCTSSHGRSSQSCSGLYNCGSIKNIGYPFWGGDRPSHCGNIHLQCTSQQETIFKSYFRVLSIDIPSQKMTIVRDDLLDSICPFQNSYGHSFFVPNEFSYAAGMVRELSIYYGCSSQVESQVQVHSNVTCDMAPGMEDNGVIFTDPIVPYVGGCVLKIMVPVLSTAYDDLWNGKISLHEAVKQGFDANFTSSIIIAACAACESSGGRCGYGDDDQQFTCHCQDKPYPHVCPKNNGKRNRMKLELGIAPSSSLVVLACAIVVCYYVYRLRKNRKIKQLKNLEALIRQYGSLAPQRYSYSDIKKMTHSFRDKLGQGGYGGVYKGKLPANGRLVAVKILNFYEGGDGEEFINEVASISQTSHVNVVTLLGFCLDGSKRALVYEFMANGSLEKYIYGETRLSWEQFYQIALGTARGLEYLHCRCNTQILHFDIKPQNILLDDDFNPKISDFGLAKLYTKKKSNISMVGTRGTIGYIAPEVFSRCFGGVSCKSDVYSYGMMVLEIVGGRKKRCGEANRSSEVYFTRWAYRRLLHDEDLVLPEATTEEEKETAKKMILIGLWCIQTDPSQRPSMSKVIEMLEGSLEDLKIPPKPFMCSDSVTEDDDVFAVELPLLSTSSPTHESFASSFTLEIELP